MAERLMVAEREAPATPAKQAVVWRPASVAVQNFRGIASVEFAMNTPVTLLCGANGQGKTSVLEALEFAHTGTVLDERGKTLKQDEYMPERGGDPVVSIYYEDATGLIRGPNPGGLHCLRRTLNPHKLQINASEVGSRDANLQLYRAFGWDHERLPTLMQADRFPRLSQAEQSDFLTQWVRGSEQKISLVSSAVDDVQREVALEIEAATDMTGADAIDVALMLIAKRRTASDKAAKQAKTELAEAQGAFAEALAEIAEGGFEGETVDEVEAELAETADEVAAALTEARAEHAKREEAEDALARLSTLSGAAQEELARAEVDRAQAAGEAEALKQQWAAREAEVVEAQREVEQCVAPVKEAAKRVDAADAAVAEARYAHRNASEAATRAAEYLQTLRGLQQQGTCPTCRQSVKGDAFADVLREAEAAMQAEDAATAQASATLEDATIAAEDARAELNKCEDALEAAKRELATAQEALNALPAIPDEAALGTRVEALHSRIDALAEEAEAAREALAMLPDDTEATVEMLQAAAAQHNVVREGLRRVRLHEEAITQHTVEVEAYEAERLACDRLKKAWQELQADSISANPALDALIAEVNGILMPVKQWSAGWTADGPVVIGPGFTRSLSRLSDGERLTVGAAWLAAMARRVGLGLVMIDHAAEIDDAAFADFMAACVAIGEASGVRFLIARPQVVDAPEGIRVVELRAGRAINGD